MPSSLSLTQVIFSATADFGLLCKVDELRGEILNVPKEN